MSEASKRIRAINRKISELLEERDGQRTAFAVDQIDNEITKLMSERFLIRQRRLREDQAK